MGRPSKYTPALADEIIERVSNGETLTFVCVSNPKMPTRKCVYDWLQGNEEFMLRFARARDEGADAIAEEALSIANTPLEGLIEKSGPDGTTITREDMLGHRRLQVETRLKLLAKWSPKKYGDKIDVEHSGNLDIKVTIGGAQA